MDELSHKDEVASRILPLQLQTTVTSSILTLLLNMLAAFDLHNRFLRVLDPID